MYRHNVWATVRNESTCCLWVSCSSVAPSLGGHRALLPPVPWWIYPSYLSHSSPSCVGRTVPQTLRSTIGRASSGWETRSLWGGAEWYQGSRPHEIGEAPGAQATRQTGTGGAGEKLRICVVSCLCLHVEILATMSQHPLVI